MLLSEAAMRRASGSTLSTTAAKMDGRGDGTERQNDGTDGFGWMDVDVELAEGGEGREGRERTGMGMLWVALLCFAAEAGLRGRERGLRR
jgi:hypothetical protein